jgi:hypothetical protein
MPTAVISDDIEEAIRGYDAELRALRERLGAGDDVSVAEVVRTERRYREVQDHRKFCLFLELHALRRALADHPDRPDLAARLGVVLAQIRERFQCYPAVETLLQTRPDANRPPAAGDADMRSAAISYWSHCVFDSLSTFPVDRELELIRFLLERADDQLQRNPLEARRDELMGQPFRSHGEAREPATGNVEPATQESAVRAELAAALSEAALLRMDLAAAEAALAARDASLQRAASEVEALRAEAPQVSEPTASLQAEADDMETLRAEIGRVARREAEQAAALADAEAASTALQAKLTQAEAMLAERNATVQQAAAEVGELVIELARERDKGAAAAAEVEVLRAAIALAREGGRLAQPSDQGSGPDPQDSIETGR